MGSVLQPVKPSCVVIHVQPEPEPEPERERDQKPGQDQGGTLALGSLAKGAILRVSLHPSARTPWGIERERVRLYDAFHEARLYATFAKQWEGSPAEEEARQSFCSGAGRSFPPWCVPIQMRDGSSLLLHCLRGERMPEDLMKRWRAQAADNFTDFLTGKLGADGVKVVRD
jgi:hypothetical protein